jgi:plasmid stabilization system protein ParE
MAEKIIIWSSRANSELKNILEFYTVRNGNSDYSLKLLNGIGNILKTLSKSEFIGRLTSDKRTRVVVMDVYLIFYQASQTRIEILSFWDNRQNDLKKIKL